MPEHYCRELLRYFNRSAGDRDVAADFVPSAYTRIYALQRSAGTVLDARALLYKTARNLAASSATRRQTEQRVLAALSLVAPTSAPSAESTAMARQQLGLFLQRLEPCRENAATCSFWFASTATATEKPANTWA
jgi:RNA polymerase sigma-70 factor (ECF subfamily)